MGLLVYIKIKICTIYNLLHFHCGFKTQKFHSVSGGEGCHNNASIHMRANAERKTQACRKHTHTHHTCARKVEHWWVAGFPLKPAVQKRLGLQVHMHGGECARCDSSAA